LHHHHHHHHHHFLQSSNMHLRAFTTLRMSERSNHMVYKQVSVTCKKGGVQHLELQLAFLTCGPAQVRSTGCEPLQIALCSLYRYWRKLVYICFRNHVCLTLHLVLS
jgi:hypothetical protein